MGSVAVARRLSCSKACGIFPRSEIQPMSPALASRFFTTEPSGKPCPSSLKDIFARQMILFWQFFAFSTWKVSYQLFRASCDFWWKKIHHHLNCFFTIGNEVSFFSYFLFLGVDFLEISSFGIHSSWTFTFMSFEKSGKFNLAVILLSSLSVSPSFSASPSFSSA